MGTSKPLTLSLPSELIDRIDRICAVEDRSRAELIGEAVQWYMERLPVEDPSEEDVGAIEQGRRAIARGDYVNLDDLLDELDAGSRPSR